MIKKFDNWKPDYDIMDSGKGRKVWLKNPHNENTCGWFKYVKMTKNKGDENLIPTFENVSEKIAEIIAHELKLSNAKIDIGTYHGEIGCLSYNVLRENQKMSEGVSFIAKVYPMFNMKSGIDNNTGIYYCIDMILNSLPSNLKKDFFKLLVFDFIIGNSDRHWNNWAIITTNTKKEYLAPMYDNGSSLCSLIKESEIEDYLGSDKLKIKALVDTSSRTIVRINGNSKKISTHKEVMEYLKNNYYEDSIDFVEFVIKRLDYNRINDILRQVLPYISHKRFILLRKFLIEKVKLLSKIYFGGDLYKKC